MKRLLKNIFKLASGLFLAFIFHSLLWVTFYKFAPVTFTPHMVFRFWEWATEGEPHGINLRWRSYGSVSPNLIKAVTASEDARFLNHGGIDWKAVDEARKYNLRHKGRKKRGASTITMQTAKNAFLTHNRTYIRKAFEVYFSYLMEAIWGKKRILEVYVNIVEWGKGVYGAEEASRKYFGKSADKLSKREAALLAAVLPNPIRWSPARPTNYISRRASTIMARMNAVEIPKIEKSKKKKK